MKYRTPLSKVRGLGAASEGAAHWWMQRLTAVALVPLALWFAFSIAALSGADYASLVSWIRLPAVSVFLIVLIIAALYHMQLGLKVIIEDYIHVKWLNLLLIIGVDLLSMVLIVTGILSVLKIVLGAN